ncbi:MAG: rhodanese-like domain-containing protein [Desulfobulbaceae bacterium]|nr:rhodanese-like domain-containing protein [Desulfobulbaceae bacterium]
MSPKSAGLAKKAGYENIKVLLEGEPAWTKAGYPTYASTGFVSKGNIVLIDLRSFEKSKNARIPRSITIPYDTLDEMVDDIPKKAPIVLYSDNEKEAFNALQELREEGFKKVSLVYGDLDRWLKADGNFESGPVVTEIKWQRNSVKGKYLLRIFSWQPPVNL